MTKEHHDQDEKQQQLNQAEEARLTPYPQGQRGKFSVKDPERGPSNK